MALSVGNMIKNQYVKLLKKHIIYQRFKPLKLDDIRQFQSPKDLELKRLYQKVSVVKFIDWPLRGFYKTPRWLNIILLVLCAIIYFGSSSMINLVIALSYYVAFLILFGLATIARQKIIFYLSKSSNMQKFHEELVKMTNCTIHLVNNSRDINTFDINSCGKSDPEWFNIFLSLNRTWVESLDQLYLEKLYKKKIYYFNNTQTAFLSYQVHCMGEEPMETSSGIPDTPNKWWMKSPLGTPIYDDKSDTEKQQDLDQSLNELENMIGLQSVKDYITEMKDMVALQKERSEMGQSLTINGMHMLFTGNPGTGKTTVARTVAKILRSLGVVTQGHLVEVTREDLVAEWIGQTAPKTRKVIDKAIGGVLFIDEAYSLARGGDNDFGREVIDTLVKAMEENRSNLVVILAGYTKEMNDFLKTNSGLKSRFSNNIEFPDYTPNELLQIAKYQLQKEQFTIDIKTERALLELLTKKQIAGRNDDGNGRLVRNVIQEAIRRQSSRLKQHGKFSKEELGVLLPVDFGVLESEQTFDLEQQFSQIVGNEEVKEHIRTLVAQLNIQKIRREKGLAGNGTRQSLHMVFKGNPGTGKTTFARLMGRALKDTGILKSGQLIETDRSGLVSGYRGQTASKVNEVIKEALGGILFIDEAYALASGGIDDPGREAIDTLVKGMEDHRESLLVVLAGYNEEMDNFFNVNAGLKSRFPHIFQFKDYTAEEMYQILQRFAKQENYRLASGCEQPIILKCTEEIRSTTSSNGRFVRNLFEKAVGKQSVRLQKEGFITDDDLITMKPEDFTD